MDDGFIRCLICDKLLKSITPNHLHNHNITVEQYQKIFPNARFEGEAMKLHISQSNKGKKRSQEVCQKFSKDRKGKKLLPKHVLHIKEGHIGLKHSEETKNKIRKSNIGQKRSEEACKNISNSVKGKKRHMFSLIHCQRISESLKIAKNTSEARKAQSRLTSSREYNHIGNSSLEHTFTKLYIALMLVSLGYSVYLEKFVTVNTHRYAIDIYATKYGSIIIIEVGSCKRDKLLNLMSRYSVVLQVPKIIKMEYSHLPDGISSPIQANGDMFSMMQEDGKILW